MLQKKLIRIDSASRIQYMVTPEDGVNTTSQYSDYKLSEEINSANFDLLSFKDNKYVIGRDRSDIGKTEEDIDKEISHMVAKAKMLGYEILGVSPYDTDVETKSKIYLFSSARKMIIYIPSDVVYISDIIYRKFKDAMCDPGKTLEVVKVIGGHGLRSTENMFMVTKEIKLDLTALDTSQVIRFDSMFEYFECDEFKHNLRFDNAFSTHKMFFGASLVDLDLSNREFPVLHRMDEMFKSACMNTLDIRGISVPNDTFDFGMFTKHQINSILSD